MFRLIEGILNRVQIGQLRKIAQDAEFIDGKISNPHSKVKNNLHMHDQTLQQQCAQLLTNALLANEDFRNFALPAKIAPPLITRYEIGMSYGIHHDSPLMNLGNSLLRSDVSCTVFVSDPADYKGGALHIQLGTESLRIKGPAGSAIVYPSHTLHEVEEVESGERLVGLTFIQSQIQDSYKRELLYELGEVSALEGLQMSDENFTRLRTVQSNLQRMWSDT